MKVYISGSSLDCGKMRMHFKMLSTIENIEVIQDWTTLERLPLNKTSYSDASISILDKIKETDTLLAIMDCPTRSYRGTFSEIGMALALGKKIIVFNPSDTPVFSFMPSGRFETSLHYQNDNITSFTDMRKLVEYLKTV